VGFFVFFGLQTVALGGTPAEKFEQKQQAIRALNSQNYDQAVKLLDKAYSDDRFDEELKKMLADAYAARGWENIQKEKFEAAISDLKQARIYEPSRQATTYLGLGYACFRSKEIDDALYYLMEATSIDPNDERSHQLLGQIYYQRGRLDDAILEWERVLEIKPDDKDIKAMLDRVKKEQGVEKGFNARETFFFNVKYEGDEKRELGDEVLSVLSKASSNVGGDLGFYPREPITVILYTRKQFNDVTNAPAWSGAIFDGSIRVPVGGEVDKTVLAAILYHEYTHAVVHSLAGRGIPTWLDEGIAQYSERYVRTPPRGEKVRPVGLTTLSGSFMGMTAKEEVNQAYAASLSAVEYFVDRYGIYNLSQIVKMLGEGKNLSDAMNEVAGVTLDQFSENWNQSLR
jgi:tetratricopeptide (TPR) repeat protein